MNGQEYLNQISAKSQQQKPKMGGGGILKSKFFLAGVIGVVLFIVIMIFGMALGGNKGNDKSKCFDLAIRLNNTGEVVGEYQPSIKSSTLRSNGISLSGVLADTNKKLMNYLEEKYSVKNLKDAGEKALGQAKTEQDALATELFEAKINGILERVFAHKMAYEITTIMSKEAELKKTTKNEALIEILDQSHDSLENLYDKFNNFSETNN